MSQTPNQNKDQEPGDESDRVNPFEKCRLNNLQHAFWSPTIFENVHMGETPPQKGWTIDQLAVLFPKPIEDSPSSHMNEYPVDPAMEAKAQKDIDKFFSSGLIVPTPEGVIQKRSNILYKPYPETTVPATTKRSIMTQSQLSLPPILPPSLESALASFNQTEVECEIKPNEPLQAAETVDDESNQSGSRGYWNLRRRLELSFGEPIPQEDPQEPNDRSSIELPYGDPFGRHHKMVSPIAQSCSAVSSPLRSNLSSCGELRIQFRRCEFTPGSPRSAEDKDIGISSPGITPIRDDVVNDEVHRSCSGLDFESASAPETPLVTWNYNRVDKQSSMSFSSTPTGNGQRMSFSRKAGFRRRKLISTSPSENCTASYQSPLTLNVGETDSNVGNGSHHALYIRIVLQNTFDYLDLNSVKNCRLVCKAWNEASFLPFKRKSIFSLCVGKCKTLKLKQRFSRFHQSDEEVQLHLTTTDSFSSIHDVFPQGFPNGLPYGTISLSLYEDEHTEEVIKESVILASFAQWGKCLKGIRLNSKYPANFNTSLVKILTEACPNLEELDIRDSSNFLSKDLTLNEGQLPSVKKIIFGEINFSKEQLFPAVSILFKAASNVEMLDFTIKNQQLSHYIASTIPLHGKKVKVLSWNDILSDRDIQALGKTPGEMSLKVLRLNCIIIALESTTVALLNFLTRHSKTLEALYISGSINETYYDDDDSDDDDGVGMNGGDRGIQLVKFFKLELPVLDELVSFELRDIFHCRIETLDFVLRLPNLQKLVLNNISYASDVRPLTPDQLFAELVNPSMELLRYPHQNLKELDLHGEIMNPEFVIILAKCFPNLKAADLFVNSGEVLLKVFKTFTRLEELTIKFKPGSCDPFGHALRVAFALYLPNMIELKKLKLICDEGAHPFLLNTYTVESVKNMIALQRIELVNFAINKEDFQNNIEGLASSRLVIFKNCSIQTSVDLDASYQSGIQFQ